MSDPIKRRPRGTHTEVAAAFLDWLSDVEATAREAERARWVKAIDEAPVHRHTRRRTVDLFIPYRAIKALYDEGADAAKADPPESLVTISPPTKYSLPIQNETVAPPENSTAPDPIPDFLERTRATLQEAVDEAGVQADITVMSATTWDGKPFVGRDEDQP